MTTVAWDGKEVASDSMLSGDGATCPGDRTDKVFVLPDGRLFCGSGDWEECMLAFDWLSGGHPDKKPHLKDFGGMIVSDTGVEAVTEGLRPYPLKANYYAIGSGWQAACTAMELGKTATQAVALAMKFDRNTGGQIKTYIPTKTVRKRKPRTVH